MLRKVFRAKREEITREWRKLHNAELHALKYRGFSLSGPGFDLRSGQFSWLRLFRSFSSTKRQMSGKRRPHLSPDITAHHNQQKSFITVANNPICRRALKPSYALYSSPNKIRNLKETTEMGRTCSAYGRIQKSIQSFSGKTWGRRPLGRSRRRWEDNIKMDLREMDYDKGTG